MGRAVRDRMKRKLVASHNNLERSYAGIIFLHDLFKDVHPELAEGLVIGAELINQAQLVLEVFAMKSWNLNKERFDAYRSK